MKKIITSLLIMIAATAFAQDRVNGTLPTISTTISGQLLIAKGWLLNPEGQWISRPNRIPESLTSTYQSLIDFEKHKPGIDNFTYFQLRKIIIGDSTYQILIKKYKTGEFQYPAIEQDWLDENAYVFYIFSQSQLSKFNSIKPDTINLIKIPIIFSGGNILLTGQNIIQEIQNEINRNFKIDTTETLIINLNVLNKKNVVQFMICEKFTSSYSSSYMGLAGGYDYSSIPWDYNYIFKNHYYETDISLFKGLFKI